MQTKGIAGLAVCKIRWRDEQMNHTDFNQNLVVVECGEDGYKINQGVSRPGSTRNVSGIENPKKIKVCMAIHFATILSVSTLCILQSDFTVENANLSVEWLENDVILWMNVTRASSLTNSPRTVGKTQVWLLVQHFPCEVWLAQI